MSLVLLLASRASTTVIILEPATVNFRGQSNAFTFTEALDPALLNFTGQVLGGATIELSELTARYV